MTHYRLPVTLFALAVAVFPAAADTHVEKTDKVDISATVVADGLSHPWGMDILPDGALLVTEREGRLRIARDGELSEPATGLPEIAAEGQGGLLDIALAPDFADSAEVYFTFSEPGPGGAGTALGRAVLEDWDSPAPRLSGVETIFSMAKKTGTGHHFGSRIVFAGDGTVFVTTGDRGDSERAQDLSDHAGAVLRVNRDGSIPEDNPYAGDEAAAPEIWSKGHRNLQGAALDPQTGALWTVEHGARGGDEINRPEAGKNYGWPVISYGRHYSGAEIGVGTEAPGYEQPQYYWDPSIAPSGMAVYQGEMFPEWNGDLLVGALKYRMLVHLDRDESGAITGEERLLEGAFGRVRDVTVAPDGSIYLLTDEDPGAIVRVTRD
ncbi:PQQ-dependent sugar dehydrogenase [Oricola indica]|uniref:PQQ-dependent sugar dehydrogenase n=1 Tax=Oricola indica TaxID=2872591 RepID=UPI003CCC23DA